MWLSKTVFWKLLFFFFSNDALGNQFLEVTPKNQNWINWPKRKTDENETNQLNNFCWPDN